ncbi:flavodoxin family protein [Oceanidesulfovibrio marinus]|uniref:NADPH-dependent FMN reductase n=1 Tax=Oceanidesulfovibrio marinus TaxID=370038 RepID=A0A6P1ZHV8_9BACT|nr:flavodoxin family protein [Oceanidesulfovibrio marinus]TVM33157.1 NADPH-dependent FMN reductase [Oceanidesulfovibrio marinus]
MNIVSILGSPRPKGNSAAMERRLLDAAEARGHEVQRFELGKLQYTGCIACFGCKKKAAHCIVKDDLAPVLAAVRECDVLVVATPVYFGEVSAQFKGFIDRCFSFLVPDYAQTTEKSRLAPGKQMVWLIAQGHPKTDLFADIYPRYEYFFDRYINFDRCHLVRACGVYNAGDVDTRDDVREQIDTLAEKLFG